jgi:hypothetical protein
LNLSQIKKGSSMYCIILNLFIVYFCLKKPKWRISSKWWKFYHYFLRTVQEFV